MSGNNLEIIVGNVCEVCQKFASRKCAGCLKVFYCTRDHQKDDWRKHKSNCKPYKVCQNTALGRYLEATRAIKSGDVILQEAPIIWGPSHSSIPICLGCGKAIDENNSRPCRKCGWPVCSDLCEKAPGHLPECRYTSQRGEKVTIKNFGIPHPIYRCITVLRCLYQKQFLPKYWKQIDAFESHCALRKLQPNYETERIAVSEFIRRFFKLSTTFSEEEIMRVCGIVTVNSHEVPLTDPPYIAIYSTASILEHNCSANCTKSFTSEGHILITAAKPILSGEHLSICYCDALWGTPNRRYFLNETKFFWCHCPRCEDPTEFGTFFSSLKCQNANCNGLVLPNTFTNPDQNLPDWVCGTCSNSMSWYSAHDILERIGRDLSDLSKSDPNSLKGFLKTYQEFLPPNHFYCTDVKYALSQLGQEAGLKCLDDDDLVLKLNLCQALIVLIRIIAPSEKRMLGLVLFEYHAALTEQARRKSLQNPNRDVIQFDLLDSRKILMEAIENLKHESEIFPEGKICTQARQNLKHINLALKGFGMGNLF